MAKRSKIRRFRALEFWAEGGCVIVVDDRDGVSHVMPRRTWLERLRALNLGNTREKFADERVEVTAFVEQGIEVAREAKAQGDPMDPKVIEQQIRTRRRNVLFSTGEPNNEPARGLSSWLPDSVCGDGVLAGAGGGPG